MLALVTPAQITTDALMIALVTPAQITTGAGSDDCSGNPSTDYYRYRY